MAPIAKPLRLRLFLEGEEVPVVSAQVSININAPATATIQVVPVDSVMDLLPRTMVHLFYLDTSIVASDGTYGGSRNTYRLLFAGELVGYSFVQTPQSRGIILQCLDFSNYWDFAHASAIEYGPGSNPFFDSSAIHGGNPGVFDDIVDQQANRLVEWLKKKPKTEGLTNVDGLAGGIISMLEAIAGVPGHHKGINDFFTIAELRCRIMSQITAEEGDYTAARVLDVKVFHQWLKNDLQNMGKTVTFRDMLKMLFQYIFYEFIPNPAAKWDAAVVKGGPQKIISKPYPLANTPGGRSALDSLQSAKNYLEPVSVASSEAVEQVKNNSGYAIGWANKAKATLQNIIAPKPEFKSKLGVIQAKLDGLIMGLSISNKNPEANSKIWGKLSGGYSQVIDEIMGLIRDAGGEFKSVSYKSDSASQRLRSHIIRPDCWFSAPPKCNVIFPEYYTQFQFERQFVSEVTRSLVQFGIELIGPDQLLDNFVMFPNAALTAASLTKKKGEAGYRYLMDHEIHTGIIPRSEWLPDTASVGASGDPALRKKLKDMKLSWTSRAGLFHFFKYRFAPRQASVGMRFNPFLVCGFPAVVLRQPYIVAGLSAEPGTPTKKVFDEISRRARTPATLAPYQFVGMIGSLSHNIDQSGGTTNVSMHHVRRHSGLDDDFLNVLVKTDEGYKTRTVRTVVTYRDAYRDGKIDTSLMNLLAGCTPQSSSKSGSKSVSGKSKRSSTATSQRKIGSNTEEEQSTTFEVISEQNIDPKNPPERTQVGKVSGIDKTQILVPSPAGKIKPGAQNGKFAQSKAKVVGVEVLDATVRNVKGFGDVFGAVAIYEDVKVTVTDTLPFEELIRPPWFSANYANVNIGKKIYTPFFGCGSVIDDLMTEGVISSVPVLDSNKADGAYTFESDKKVDEVMQALEAQYQQFNAASIENALNLLSFIYGKIRTQGLDVDAFIRSYIDRPIATLEEILGSKIAGGELDFDVDAGGRITVNKGLFGFHTAAVEPTLVNQGRLAGLIVDADLQMTRINNVGANDQIHSRDVRKAKKDRVLSYIADLGGGEGSKGGQGLRG